MTLVQRVNFNLGLSDTGKGSLCSLTSASKSSLSTGVLADIQTSLLLEFGLEMLEEVVVEIFSSKVGISSNSLDSENSVSDCEERNIKSSTTEIEDEDILLLGRFRIKTVSDGCGGGFVDDTKDVETGDCTGVFGRVSLTVGEVCRDSDNGFLNLLSESNVNNVWLERRTWLLRFVSS